MILVAGEALIDMAYQTDLSNSKEALAPFNLQATVGGGPLNAAVAAARLGANCALLTGLSTDAFGEVILEHLRKSHVNECFLQRNDLPSMLALAAVDKNGDAQYQFYMHHVSTSELSRQKLDSQLAVNSPTVLLLGGLGLVVEPSAHALINLATQISSSHSLVMVDPNIRLQAISDEKSLRRKLERLFALTTIVKLSDDDALFFAAENGALTPWLAKIENSNASIPDDNPISVVIYTQGAQGIRAITRSKIITMPIVTAPIVDTIGAGDSVNGALLYCFETQGITTPEQVLNLSASRWEEILGFCMKVAAVTVSRAGANPPWHTELT